MGFRFKKVIKIAPGIKLNISKSGVSTSLGPNGATMNIGKNGVKGTLGLPGTGLSYQRQLINKKGEVVGRGTKYEGTQPLPVPYRIELDGKKPLFVNENGTPYATSIQTALKRAYAEEVRAFLFEKVNEGNEISNKIANIQGYYEVSDYLKGEYTKKTFQMPQPNFQEVLDQIKREKGSGFFSSLFNNFEKDANDEYQSQLAHYNAQKQEWDQDEESTQYFANQMQQLRRQASNGNIESMNILLEQILMVAEAPIRFSGSFELDGINGLWLDIDLPEIEEIPDEEYSVTQTGQLSVKKKTEKKKKEDYSRLVSGILLILASNVFELLPTIETIVISGYTQRLNKQTGFIQDDYIYSYIVEKHIFRSINLQMVDPVAAMDNFTGVRQLSKTFEWKAIQPYYNGNN